MLLRFIGGVLERVVVVVSALSFAQIPLFIQHYEQQLVGRIAELKMQVDAIQVIAKDRSLHEYIFKFTSNSDPDFVQQGNLLFEMVNRYDSLQTAYANLQNATLFTKPVVFVNHLYSDIAASTWEHFHLGLPLTVEGAAYAFVGVIVGMCVTSLMGLVIEKSAEKKLRARKKSH